ncbi:MULTISPECIES: ABC transporter permease [unclassified Streptomyces]|uniref:ABC transporter permease n=1 Tax=unclassified Streptomyces TaxID=2593676 RepID=UPI0029B764D8|nr:ABC transporter permease [Streptomyces sp. ME18-1-4]MDX3246581.1 ABC transporter permease [Streptomyces sp. ME18-1-4]
MRRHFTLFATAARYDLTEHARNRFAMLLVVLYVPTWITLAYLVIPDKPAPFQLAATGEFLAPAGNELTQITGAINAATLITGFMMFSATFSGGRFDRRLAMAGYPRTHLILAKTASLTVASATVAAYATAVVCATWTPRQPALLAAALFCASMTYGAIGVVYGSLLKREVEGMFAMVMTSVVDVALQNPISSSGAESPVVRLLPTYGTVQAATAAGFSTTPAVGHLAVQLLWFTAAGLLSLLTFHHRTRNALTAAVRIPRQKPPQAGDAKLMSTKQR